MGYMGYGDYMGYLHYGPEVVITLEGENMRSRRFARFVQDRLFNYEAHLDDINKPGYWWIDKIYCPWYTAHAWSISEFSFDPEWDAEEVEWFNEIFNEEMSRHPRYH